MDEMISRTGKPLPAAAGLYPVFTALPFVLACQRAAAGSNFGVLKKGLPYPQGLTLVPETAEAAVADPTTASISAPGPPSPKGRELAGGLGNPHSLA